mgnify:CR=1 FL=1
MIWSIAWKNVWRNKTRSLVVIIAITLGIFGGVFAVGIMMGMVEERIHSAIHNEVSHIQIHHPDYLANNDISFYIDSVEQKLEEIEKMPEVKAATKRLKIMCMASTTSTGTGINLLGVVPDQEMEVTDLHTEICDSAEIASDFSNPEKILEYVKDSCGHYFKSKRSNRIVIGKKLAEKLDVDVRSKIVITMQAIDGNLTGGAFRVEGIYDINNSMYEENHAFVRYKDLSALTGFDSEAAHEISVILHETEHTEKVIKTLEEKYPLLNIMAWKEIQPDLGLQTQFMEAVYYFFIVIILFALGFGIVNTMLMVVMERIKELGMLMAVGMNKVRIFSMIMLETIFLSLTGAVIGMILSGLAIWYFGNAGINISQYAEGFEAIGYKAILHPEISAEFYFGVTGLVIITGIIASIYPARKALKLNPADAIRIE